MCNTGNCPQCDRPEAHCTCLKPTKGKLAFCSLNSLGLITHDGLQPVTYSDGSKGMAYIGIHLTDKIAPIGSPWSSRTPAVVGEIRIAPHMSSNAPNLVVVDGRRWSRALLHR